MFQSDTHKPQLLPSDAYSDPASFAAEWEQLFAPAWHCVATLSDFPRDGDYRTLTLGRYPLILRRDADTVHAYLKVCPHRFSLLRHAPCGNLPKLQCQYHGWEFSACRNTQRIPDAKSFKPLKKGMLGLTTYQTQTCGDLIFVNLHPEPRPLAEFLGENGKLIEAWFSPDWRPMMTYDVSVAANWKAYLENGIESYHSEAVHSKTLVQSPVEDLCEHELGDGYTIFRSRQPDPRATVRAIDRWHHRLLQVTPRTLHPLSPLPTSNFYKNVSVQLHRSGDSSRPNRVTHRDSRLRLSWPGSKLVSASDQPLGRAPRQPLFEGNPG